MKGILALIASTALVVLFSTAVTAETKYSYSNDIKPIFAANCSACHDWDQGYTKTVGPKSQEPPTTGLRIVYPAKPDSSVLVWRLEGKTASGTVLESMPKFAEKLPADTIKKIRDWISQGAPELVTAVKYGTWGEVKNKFR